MEFVRITPQSLPIFTQVSIYTHFSTNMIIVSLWLSLGFISGLLADSTCDKSLIDCRQGKSMRVHQIQQILGQSTSPFVFYQGITEDQILKAYQHLETLSKEFSEWHLA